MISPVEWYAERRSLVPLRIAEFLVNKPTSAAQHMSADTPNSRTDGVQELVSSSAPNGISPELERMRSDEALKSPLTSVKHLLADTDAAPPRQKSLHQRQKEVAFADAPLERKGKGKGLVNPDGSAHESPTFQQTLQDLRAFLAPFLKLLPFQSFQTYLKRFIGPFVRSIVTLVAKILYKWQFGLASNLAYDLHLLLWKVRRRRIESWSWLRLQGKP